MVKRLILPLILLFIGCHRKADALFIFFSTPWRLISPYGTPLPPEYQARYTIYEPLVWQVRDGFLPGLAESWITLDDTTWVFQLVTNALFHDGKKFTGKDVVYSFKNYMKRNPQERMKFYIKKTVVMDSFSIKFILHKNNPLFLSMVSSVPIVSPRLEGTGPFFIHCLCGDTIILKRFKEYREPVPFEYLYILSPKDVEERLQALSTVKYGIAFRLEPGLDRLTLPKTIRTKSLKTYAVKYIAFTNPHNIDKTIRHIIYYATRGLDFSPSGEMIYQFIPLLNNFYSPIIEDSIVKLHKKAHVKPLEEPINLTLVHWITIKKEGEMIRDALKPFNIRIELIPVDNVNEWMKRIKQEDMFIITVFFNSQDVLGVWSNIFGEFVNANRIKNYLSGLKPETFTELKRASDSLQWLLFEEMPLIPLYNRVETIGYTNNIDFRISQDQFVPLYTVKRK